MQVTVLAGGQQGVMVVVAGDGHAAGIAERLDVGGRVAGDVTENHG